ncbi:ADP-ribosylation factor family-domain-containing protein [Mycena latifolia]|nr:ADP-ribosylation factor family-domain-containing protein [Mycena latifolia]
MGSALSSAVANADRFFPSVLPKAFVVLMVGLDDAGKTSLLNRLHRRELPLGVLPLTTPSIGFTIGRIPYGRHSVTLWDFGGSDPIRPIWRLYFRTAHAFIFALDAAVPERFPTVEDELHRLHRCISSVFPLLVLANKIDLAGAVDLDAISEALGVEALASTRPSRAIAVKGISAMTGEGIEEALQWVRGHTVFNFPRFAFSLWRMYHMSQTWQDIL